MAQKLKIARAGHLVSALAASAACMVASAASTSAPAPGMPRLVVGIVVEGLSESDLARYSDRFGSGGFQRLARQGVVIPNVDYGEARGTAAVAMITTGATPAVNGIDSPTLYDRTTGRTTSVVSDPAYIGNSTSETVSPAPLRVSTLADELRIATGAYGRSYSIAPVVATAVITAGHAGGSAVWISDTDGRWATSTYYRDVPEAVTRRNYRNPLSQRLDTIYWVPQQRQGAAAPFRYDFSRSATDRYRRFKATPRAGDEVTALACDYLGTLSSTSRDGATDMLTVSYSVAPYPYGLASSAAMMQEQADAYARLDGQISSLLSEIERTAGLEGTLVFVAGVPAQPLVRPTSEVEIAALPTGDFSPRKAKALLNMYLMALYGNGEWVSGYHDGWFYLNTELATQRNVPGAELRARAAEFLQRMSGVTDARTAESLLADPSVRPYISTAHTGDVRIAIQPGWRLTETDDARSDGMTVRLGPAAAPLFILYPPLQPTLIDTTVGAEAVAPTLARIIRIRAPNGATGTPLPLQLRP